MGKYTELYEKLFVNQNPFIHSMLKIFFIFVLGLLLWWIFNFFISNAKKAYAEKPFFKKNQNVFPIIKKAGHYSILIFIGINVINVIQLPLLEKIFYAFMIMLLATFANSIFKDIVPYLAETVTSRTKTKFDDVIFDLLDKFASLVIFVLAVMAALDILGVNIMPLIAGAGVAGIAVGFAAKDTLSNIIAGVLLILDRPFEVGDRIEVWSAPRNSATWGDVVDVGLRATRIRTTDNIVIVIPNNEIMKRDIINYTTISKEIRVRIPIGIAYNSDVDKAKKVIISTAFELEWVMKEPAPKVVVKDFGESAVNLEARIWISDPRKRMDTISHISDRVKVEFDRAGIEIPFPKRDIYIKKEV